MQKYSAWTLLREAFGGQRGWQSQWRRASPAPEYDAIIIGGGGHGLAAAYYLAAEHGITRTAVLEKGWIGGGSTGRNTTIIRSNYLFDESARLYDHALNLWQDLSQVLNYNVMYLAARRHDARARRARRAGAQAPCAREPLQRRDQRVADPGGGEGVLSAAQH